MNEKGKIFVVIPAFNEAAVIEKTISDVKKYYQNVVVVDDGSTDETADSARAGGGDILKHIINRGQGAALRSGIDYALDKGAEIIITFDADGQFEPEEMRRLCAPIEKDECDIVLGSRFLTKNSVPFLRRLLLKGAILLTRAITGLDLTDAHNGFRALSRKAAEKIVIRQDRMAHASDILHEIARLKLRYREVPVAVKYTAYSRKKGQKLSGAGRILFDIIFK